MTEDALSFFVASSIAWFKRRLLLDQKYYLYDLLNTRLSIVAAIPGA